MSSKIRLLALVAAQCALAGMIAAAQAAQTVPGYFFREWTVTSNCTEQHAGLAARVATGLKFKISPDTLAEDGSYRLTTLDTTQAQWAAGWNGLKLEYRAGPAMTTVPADFECVPGEEPTSSFLSMSGFAQAAEPYYEEAHWYGLATIAGQEEHVLIFVRPDHGPSSAIIVLQSVNTPSTLQLDDDGVVTSED
jgi:hypothetical protein